MLSSADINTRKKKIWSSPLIKRQWSFRVIKRKYTQNYTGEKNYKNDRKFLWIIFWESRGFWRDRLLTSIFHFVLQCLYVLPGRQVMRKQKTINKRHIDLINHQITKTFINTSIYESAKRISRLITHEELT